MRGILLVLRWLRKLTVHSTQHHALLLATDEDTMAAPHPEKPKVASKYRTEWERYHMRPSKKGVTFTFCKICNVDVAICNFLSDSV